MGVKILRYVDCLVCQRTGQAKNELAHSSKRIFRTRLAQASFLVVFLAFCQQQQRDPIMVILGILVLLNVVFPVFLLLLVSSYTRNDK